MKYLYQDGDETKLDVTPESFEVALKLAKGADYCQCDLDPFEAGTIICMVKDAASTCGDAELVQSCEQALQNLRVHLDAFAVLIDYTW